MSEQEFINANNLYSVRLMKSILAGIIPNEIITEQEQNDLKMMLHKWEHRAHKSFDVEEEKSIVEDSFSVNSEQDEDNVTVQLSNEL